MTMSESRKYRLDSETLLYEVEKVSKFSRVFWFLGFLISSGAVALLYFWIFTSLLGFDLPKTAYLKKQNARWASKIELLSLSLDRYEKTLSGLGMRDDEIYRNVFGLNPIAPEIRNSGFGGVNRYAYLDNLPDNSLLKRTVIRLDILSKKEYVQSKSFDEIETLSKKAGDMASCIPAVPPLFTDPTKYRLSSRFGYRSDPINGSTKMHTGFDFSCKPGNPVYATGDGVVSVVSFELFGYGNSVTIDHGFGYKTRYAHLKNIFVAEGMTVKRGECIAETGNSGRSTGPHLHYEVMYRNRYVNPMNYFDLDMPQDEYKSMTDKAEAESQNVIVRPGQRVKVKG